MPANSRDRRRADFWLRYHKRIRNFQIAICDRDLRWLKASFNGTEASFYGRLIGATVSAFLMQFDGYHGELVVVEFSETGNAARVYDRKKFESAGITMGSTVFRVKGELKTDLCEQSITHIDFPSRSPWEIKAQQQLAELGITP